MTENSTWSPPDPKQLRPSHSGHFSGDDGWMECPAVCSIAGFSSGWYWHPDLELYGIEGITARSFPGHGRAVLRIRVSPALAADPAAAEIIQEQLEAQLNQFLALEAMG